MMKNFLNEFISFEFSSKRMKTSSSRWRKKTSSSKSFGLKEIKSAKTYIYIYIIYTSNLGSSASVLDSERKQDRFNQTREKAAEKQRKNKKNNEKIKKQ